jgi:hypothetical protein
VNDTAPSLSIASTTTWGAAASTATSVTSGTFNAASGSIVIACMDAGYDATEASTPTISDNQGGSLSWTNRVMVNSSSSFGDSACWTAPVSGALSGVTVTIGSLGAGSHGVAAAAWVVTGQNASPIGGTGSRDSGSGSATIDASVTVQAVGSYLFGCFQRGNSTTNPTYRGDTTQDGSNFSGSAGGNCSCGHLTNVTTGTGATLVGTTTADTFTLTAALEIKP